MKSLDRRYLKTEKVIVESMVSLLNQKHFQDIQIDDICSKANINKSTFYLHYQSLYRLLLSIEDSFLSSLERMVYISNPASFEEALPQFLKFFEENKKLCSALFKAGDYSLNEKVLNAFLPLFKVSNTSKKKAILSNEFLKALGVMDGILAILRAYVLNGYKLSNEFLSSLITQFMRDSLASGKSDK